ncbi:hypothetical protein CC86DRAFT_387471 [Ophiobolus disseminans]|uniref:FAD-binding domain-containing protein n=1 Tax=Ophiobolus disseminans TaxID=1469910 RepID=A0A6A6ZH89_9PLEO|nr:hypothetical protein CC86DRAFT_387471 [Ophiobolus disseminans]
MLSLDDRNGGWAITMHWVMPFLEAHLPRHVFENIKKNHIQPEVLDEKEVPIKFMNLKTGESMFERMSPVHLRVDRSKLREALSEGIDAHWGKTFESYELPGDGKSVIAKFSDGSLVHGSLLAVCDGKNSTARTQLLGPEKATVNDLPFGFIGLQLKGTAPETETYRNVAPIFWQANGTQGKGTEAEMYEVQLNVSWTLEDHEGEEPPKGNKEKLAKMKSAARA